MYILTRKIIFIVIAFVLGFSFGFGGSQLFNKSTKPSAQAVNSFEDCVAAGNPVMESYPRQCRSTDGQLFVEDVQAPEPPQGDDTFCTTQYDPVCGEVQVQCIKAPCPPIKQTFSNRCFAEKAEAFNIIPGECE